MSVLIIGAGLCGLSLATQLKSIGQPSVIVEKSRGVGGRLATRRSDSAKFDHGAQFYTLSEKLQTLHEQWQSASLVREWFRSDGKTKFCAPSGMTALAKNLSADLDVQLSRKVVKLEKISHGWNVIFEEGASMAAERVIFTSPLPQSLEILIASQIAFDPALARRQYAKALVGLIEGPAGLSLPETSAGFWLPASASIFSIADQKAKGVSSTAAWTVVMTPDFSETHFERPELESLEAIREQLRLLNAAFVCHSIELKKWRYSHPLDRSTDGFAEIQPSLFLAGDAFGAPSLGGAASSAELLLQHLSSKIRARKQN